MKYIVYITHLERSTFIVDEANPAEAEATARRRWFDGDVGDRCEDPTGIVNVSVEAMREQD